ncbi:hypothetical protein [Coxiella burnetii]|nr:hypothetical protein [Coxiella burnetii]ACJ19237.1 hypothetical protein CbuG_1995 [Coxiella burnetii CbuG_Q212]ATN67565.1 hypothetical protein AYM17_09820 [Coxiella burnetii]OYK85451.1 hypothetical protein CbuQ229_10195 [Coxiella burnetii]
MRSPTKRKTTMIMKSTSITSSIHRYVAKGILLATELLKFNEIIL